MSVSVKKGKSKEIKKRMLMEIKAKGASGAPPTGPRLGQAGVNIPEFCKQFNAETANMDSNMMVRVLLTVYEDRTFAFVCKGYPVADWLRKYAKIEKGSGSPGVVVAGKIKKKDLMIIAEAKLAEIGGSNLESAARSIAGTARSMGIVIED